MRTVPSNPEILLDVSDLGRSELRECVRAVVRDLGYEVAEKGAFWGRLGDERPQRPSGQGMLVVGDLSRIAKRYLDARPQEWAAAVRRASAHLVALVRTRRDERCASLVDDLLRHSDHRMTVCRGDASRSEIRRCLAEALAALEPDSLVDVRVPAARDRLRVEFADGLAGETPWDSLGIDSRLRERLVLESATAGSRAKTVELLTRDGELYEIDAAAIRAILDPPFAAGIEETARRSDLSVGQRIRAARRAAGLTQAVLAERIGVDQAVISRFERGRHRPRVDTLARVAEGLGLRVPDLLAG